MINKLIKKTVSVASAPYNMQEDLFDVTVVPLFENARGEIFPPILTYSGRR